jgi:hypothetical protein
MGYDLPGVIDEPVSFPPGSELYAHPTGREAAPRPKSGFSFGMRGSNLFEESTEFVLRLLYGN